MSGAPERDGAREEEAGDTEGASSLGRAICTGDIWGSVLGERGASLGEKKQEEAQKEGIVWGWPCRRDNWFSVFGRPERDVTGREEAEGGTEGGSSLERAIYKGQLVAACVAGQGVSLLEEKRKNGVQESSAWGGAFIRDS